MAGRVEYKRLLTSLLHQRFRDAFLISAAVCYAIAIATSSSFSWLWLWFPIGPAGVRTLLYLGSATCVLTLRTALVRPDPRPFPTPYAALKGRLSRVETLQVPAYYLVSALAFEWVTVWFSASDGAYTLRISPNPYARPHINERRVYLSFMTTSLALIQSCRHLYHDYDSLNIVEYDGRRAADFPTMLGSASFASVLADLSQTVVQIGLRLYRPIAVFTVLSPAVYWLLFSNLLYRLYFATFSVIFSLHDPSMQSDDFDSGDGTSLFGYSYLWTDALWISFLMLGFWDLISMAFTLSFRRPPIKSSLPLSANSPDPLTSLLNGLGSQHPLGAYYVSQELRTIAKFDPVRRAQIFSDLDRNPQIAWTAINTYCSAHINELEGRLMSESITGKSADSQSPPPPQPQIQNLPRISAPPKGDVNPFLPPKSGSAGTMESLDSFARRHGNSPSRATPARAITRLSKAVAESALEPRRLLKEMPEQMKQRYGDVWENLTQSEGDASSMASQLQQLAKRASHTFFYGTADRYANAIIQGPASQASETINCIDALGTLVSRSAKEDQFGIVAKDIGTIISRYMSCLEQSQSFNLEVQLRFKTQSLIEDCLVLKQVQLALQQRLDEMVRTFEGVTGIAGLNPIQMRRARQILEKSKVKS